MKSIVLFYHHLEKAKKKKETIRNEISREKFFNEGFVSWLHFEL